MTLHCIDVCRSKLTNSDIFLNAGGRVYSRARVDIANEVRDRNKKKKNDSNPRESNAIRSSSTVSAVYHD